MQSALQANLLLVETLKYAVARGLRSYEFLGSSERWTDVWTRQIRPCVTVAAYPKNCRGGVTFCCDAVKFGWERLGRKLCSSNARPAHTRPGLQSMMRVRCAGVFPLKVSTARCATGMWGQTFPNMSRVPTAIFSMKFLVSLAIVTCRVKAPAIHFDMALLKVIIDQAKSIGAVVHFDAMAPETADDTFRLIAKALDIYPRLGSHAARPLAAEPLRRRPGHRIGSASTCGEGPVGWISNGCKS